MGLGWRVRGKVRVIKREGMMIHKENRFNLP